MLTLAVHCSEGNKRWKRVKRLRVTGVRDLMSLAVFKPEFEGKLKEVKRKLKEVRAKRMHPHLENQELLTEERRAPHAESAEYRNLNLPKTHFVCLASGYKEASI